MIIDVNNTTNQIVNLWIEIALFSRCYLFLIIFTSGGEVVWRYERSDSPLIDTKNITKLFINDWVIAVQDSEMIIGD